LDDLDRRATQRRPVESQPVCRSAAERSDAEDGGGERTGRRGEGETGGWCSWPSPRPPVPQSPRLDLRGGPPVTGTLVQFGQVEFEAIQPELVLAVAGCLLVLLEAFAPRLRDWFATIALAAVAVSLSLLERIPEGLSFGGRFETSPLTSIVG